MPVSNEIQLPVGHSSFPNLPETKKTHYSNPIQCISRREAAAPCSAYGSIIAVGFHYGSI